MMHDAKHEDVCVVIPAYHSESTIFATLDSVCSQTRRPKEIRVIDDFSQDDIMKDQLMAYFDTNKEETGIDFHFHRLLQNQGEGNARKVGYDQTSCQYVALLDSDDLWLPEKLAEQIPAMRSSTAALCYAGSYYLPWLRKKHIRLPVPTQVTINGLLKSNIINTCSVILDKHQLGDDFVARPRSSTSMDDWRVYIHILKQGYKLIGINKPLVRNGSSSSQFSSRKKRMAKLAWKFMTIELKLPLFQVLYYMLNYTVRGVCKHYLGFVWLAKQN